MSLVFSEEQRLLQDSAAGFVAEHAPVSALRKLRDEDSADGFDRDLWKGMAQLGWSGVLIEERFGGTEFGFKGLGAVLEQTGRTLVASPLLSTALIGASLIRALGTEAQKSQWLAAIARGELITALALEESSHHAPSHIETSSRPEGNRFVLQGEKTFVLDGHVADLLLVVTRAAGADDPNAGQGLTIFALPRDAAGLTVTRTRMVDSRNAAHVRLNGVKAKEAAVLGGASTVGRGELALDHVLDLARIGVSAEMLGGVGAAFERTLAYLKTREQFGQVIGSFQALKHRAAEMFSEIELARSAVMAALDAAERRDESTALLASLAKARLSETFHRVSSEAIQMHGGIGMTDEEEIGFFLKRARVAEQAFGDARFHRDRYARLCGF